MDLLDSRCSVCKSKSFQCSECASKDKEKKKKARQDATAAKALPAVARLAGRPSGSSIVDVIDNMARPSYAKSQHVILDFQRIVVFVTFTWSHFVCSQDADAGLDEDEIVRVAHMYRVVAGDSVSRSLAHLDFTIFRHVFAS